MAASDKLSGLQFHYDQPDLGESKTTHRIRAYPESNPGFSVGTMLWNSKGIRNIESTEPRRGVATAMWNEGHRMAETNAKVPKPKHSADRTTAGDAWARSVGGSLPRKKK